jgi:hypothetical protein
MPRTRQTVPRVPTLRCLLAIEILVAAAVAGCGVPPEVRDRAAATGVPDRGPSTAPVPTATTGAPVPPTATRPPVAPSRTGFDPTVAVHCDGEPGGRQVADLLRGAGMLPAGARVSVTTGPLCAGTWQYTVLTVTRREPLQVISNGPADDLNLITAGTDVCNVPVRTIAPRGIRAIACDGVPPPPTAPTGGVGL